MKRLIDGLRTGHRLEPAEYKYLLENYNKEILAYINEQAREVARRQFGNDIFIRGLIEVSNRCKNDCYYCGIRKSNTRAVRYQLSREAVLGCCREGYQLGFRTFVLQGGEDRALTDDWIEGLVTDIRREYPDCALTLSLGEKPRQSYERFFRAGANRYLLRHETYRDVHYRLLHPAGMSRENRLRCLYDLREIGYQVGTGIMVGSPGQTTGDIVADILFIERFRPEMIGIGPFLSHKDTPFASDPDGSMELTLLLLSVFRLMFPQALIPSTTSLGTISSDGRERGVLAGANVLMPNLSPKEERKKYALYDNKICTGEEAAEGLEALRKQMYNIGYCLSEKRGDYSDSHTK